jgi:hypothetical protein
MHVGALGAVLSVKPTMGQKPSVRCFQCMYAATYYREQAGRLARGQRADINELLQLMARDYDDIAVDLDRGAIEIRHPELMPQNQR